MYISILSEFFPCKYQLSVGFHRINEFRVTQNPSFQLDVYVTWHENVYHSSSIPHIVWTDQETHMTFSTVWNFKFSKFTKNLEFSIFCDKIFVRQFTSHCVNKLIEKSSMKVKKKRCARWHLQLAEKFARSSHILWNSHFLVLWSSKTYHKISFSKIQNVF